ncbi:hypothetical protein OIY81_1554 [Cryptosporidium canis]|uniref:Uncharacterized protein n=1 Tax=Cryptosporidium canis TaxID=195482 RepID=A0ABQ8P953_9CRYT|nr:hypothetical protein OIY81_1554 [Cryptosporidium canis]KAJ1612882.1 hypothetical protein OJ252_1096 [Cryptosporidium canis]
MSQNLSPTGSSQSRDNPGPRQASYERVRVMANYLELSALEYIQRCSAESGLQLDDSTMPLFYVLSCWKLLWCLSINELIGESLRSMIEGSFTFRTDLSDSDGELTKLLSIPDISEGEVSRFAMAYSPIYRVVLGVLRWLRWESRVNPCKQDDIVFREAYYMDYPESRISWKTLRGQTRFYSLDWALNADESSISKSDRENVEEVFKVAFMLLRKGCRMQLDTFLREKAKANWLVCLVDGMDSYLYPEKQKDHYVDLSGFMEVLPKVDDMWINYNDEDCPMDAGGVQGARAASSMGSINRELALNDALFKASFEFVDTIERSLIFPASEDSPDSDGTEIEAEGNVNRPLLFSFLRQLVAKNKRIGPNAKGRLGDWELSFYSMLCGDFEQLYSVSKNNFDKLFALFHTEKMTIFNGWADFMESRTQCGRNHIFLGKTYPGNRLENALFNRLELLTRDLYPDIESDYLPEDCGSTSEYNLISKIQKESDPLCFLEDSDDEIASIGYNSSCFYHDQGDRGAVKIMELEKQLVDSLIDSIMCLDLEKDTNSIEGHFFQLYLGIIISALNIREYGDDLVRVLEEFMNYVSELPADTPTIGSLKAFVSQITIAHLEAESPSPLGPKDYSVCIFDEFFLASQPSADCLDTLEPSQASIQLEVLSDFAYENPLRNISMRQRDMFVSQYLSYILESSDQPLEVFLIMLEYSSKECRLEYIKRILQAHQKDLEITTFQKLIYNLITQFPWETMGVTMGIQDQLYGEVHDLLCKGVSHPAELLDSTISHLEFVILLFGTIFQFLIMRQDYSPSSESTLEVLHYINSEAVVGDRISSDLRESLRSLEQSLSSANPCNHTTSEVVVGMFFVNQLNPLCLLLVALEITKLSGPKDMDTIEYHQFLLNVTRSNACMQEFVIPLILEPIMIRLITVLASNSDSIGPSYSRYRLSKLKGSQSLQTLDWEQSLASIFSLGTHIRVQDVLIPFSPIRFMSSQVTFFKALALVRVYHDSVESLWECVQLSEQEAHQSENHQLGIGASGKQREPLQSPVISPGNSLLSSPFNKFTSPASTAQRRSSIQLLNIEKQIESANQSISQVVSQLQVLLQSWLVFDPCPDPSSLLEGSGDKESQEVARVESSRLSEAVLPEYCSFDRDNFPLEAFSVQHSNNSGLLKRSRFINIQKLFDQLILTVIFHHDVELFHSGKAPLFPRRSIDSGKSQPFEFKSLSFLDHILAAIERSSWIFTEKD